VIWDGPVNINLLMVAMGYAEIYRGAPCQAYCPELEQAEVKAKHDKVGIWAQGASYENPVAHENSRKLTRSIDERIVLALPPPGSHPRHSSLGFRRPWGLGREWTGRLGRSSSLRGPEGGRSVPSRLGLPSRAGISWE
jgi:hypothetical protein